jgi:hypothetical protein
MMSYEEMNLIMVKMLGVEQGLVWWLGLPPSRFVDGSCSNQVRTGSYE